MDASAAWSSARAGSVVWCSAEDEDLARAAGKLWFAHWQASHVRQSQKLLELLSKT
jgi:hypothetical protein